MAFSVGENFHHFLPNISPITCRMLDSNWSNINNFIDVSWQKVNQRSQNSWSIWPISQNDSVNESSNNNALGMQSKPDNNFFWKQGAWRVCRRLFAIQRQIFFLYTYPLKQMFMEPDLMVKKLLCSCGARRRALEINIEVIPLNLGLVWVLAWQFSEVNCT